MCAIIDACVSHELIGPRTTEVGRYFRRWLNRRRGKLIVGGKLLKELGKNSNVKQWISSALASGIAKRIPDDPVGNLTNQLEARGICISNDPHVIALAIISGSRLLYTTETDLMKDFKNRNILGGRVRGSIYTSAQGRTTVGRQHKQLLARNDLCDRPH